MSKSQRVLMAAAILVLAAGLGLRAESGSPEKESAGLGQALAAAQETISSRTKYAQLMMKIDEFKGEIKQMGDHCEEYRKACVDKKGRCDHDIAYFYSRAEPKAESALGVLDVWTQQAADKLAGAEAITAQDLNELQSRLETAQDMLLQVKLDYQVGWATEYNRTRAPKPAPAKS